MSQTHNSQAIHYQAQQRECEIFQAAANNQLPVLLKGPTGCGKTRFVEYMAQKLERPLFTIACHDDLSATDLVGRHLIGASGTHWQDGPLTRAVREGGICYLDEVVEARKDTTVVIHPLTDHRRLLPIDRTGELIEAHANFMLVVSYNPGYQNLIKGLKPSTRQRFIALEFDYPKAKLEVSVICQETGLDKARAEQLVLLGQEIRRLKDHDLEEGASTRLLIYAAKLMQSTLSTTEACMAALVQPLSDDSDTIKAIERLVNAHF